MAAGGSGAPAWLRGEHPRLHALLIGVDHYLQPRLPEGLSYPSLAGAVADVGQVERLLKQRLDVPPERIRKLTASLGREEPPEAPADRPTYKSMVAGFHWLRDVARPGEHVFVHYSGHGGRAATTLPKVKGEEGLDECLVPYDISCGGRYLRDTEINVLLWEIVDRGAFLTLVFDCCHAGGSLREGFEGSVAERGIQEIDRARRDPTSLVAPPEELAARWEKRRKARPSSGDAQRGLAGSRAPDDAPWGYTLLAACRPQEGAYEAPLGDGPGRTGALTHYLLEVLTEGGPDLTYRRVYDRLLARIYSRFRTQTPQLEGEGDRLVFGRESLPTFQGVVVLEGEEDQPGKVCLATGQAQAIRRGARFALHPAGVKGGAEPLGVAEIVELGATLSVAEIRERRPGGRTVKAGDQAVLLDPGGELLRRPVWTLCRRLEPGDVDQEPVEEAASLVRLERALAERQSGFLTLVDETDRSAGGKVEGFAVQVGDEGAYEILDASGAPLPHLRPPIRAGSAEAADRLVERLDHLARYRNVEQLANHDPSALLRGRLHLELGRLPDEFEPGDRPSPEPFAAGRVPQARVGGWVCLTVENRSDEVLNLAVLDLQPGWAVVQVYPTRARGLFEPVDPEDVRHIPLKVELPTGYGEGTDIIKVFASVGPTSYHWLELPPLDHPRRQAERGSQPANDLERLFAALAVKPPATRSVRALAPASAEWWMEQMALRVIRNDSAAM